MEEYGDGFVDDLRLADGLRIEHRAYVEAHSCQLEQVPPVLLIARLGKTVVYCKP